ncbi:MAG: peroxidase, partial [Bacteroidetes bacterium]|nr:peroxidase [Bacteroidota bacterium]
KMESAQFLLLHFNDVTKAKSWLAELADEVTNAKTDIKTLETCVNIAFTNNGVIQLGITRDNMNTFSREFEEGMTTSHRQRMFGDFDASDPEKWQWGGPNDKKKFHALLLLYAESEDKMNGLLAGHQNKLNEAQIEVIQNMKTIHLNGQKEHFGFRDGIGQPFLKGVNKDPSKHHPANQINPGEFLFGYKNEYGKYTVSPNVTPAQDKNGNLKNDMNVKSQKDLGRNGSMLVFRQMEQHVKAFWEFMDNEVKKQQIANTSDTPEMLASKMVGRWPSGAPLVKCPMHDDPKLEDFDNFGYAEKDFDGMKCPMGSHIRRTNPRDNLVRNSSKDPKNDIKSSQKFMKRFRIIRRGRAYGQPLSSIMDPHEMITKPHDGEKRGLHFLCFNSNIGRQFELMQQTWVINPKFAGLYDDPDPIIGHPGIMGKGSTTTFTEPSIPIRKKVKGIPRFVDIRGGAYFFMPGISGLRFFASL